MDYTVMGDAVNLAARLEGANKTFGTQIMVGEETVRLAGGGVEVRLLDRLRVKGKEAPVQVYELMGRGGELSPSGTGFGTASVVRTPPTWPAAGRRRRRGSGTPLRSIPRTGPPASTWGGARATRRPPPPGDWGGVFVMTAK